MLPSDINSWSVNNAHDAVFLIEWSIVLREMKNVLHVDIVEKKIALGLKNNTIVIIIIIFLTPFQLLLTYTLKMTSKKLG